MTNQKPIKWSSIWSLKE